MSDSPAALRAGDRPLQFHLGELILFVYLAGVLMLVVHENYHSALLWPVGIQIVFCILSIIYLFTAPSGSASEALRQHPELLLPGLFWIHGSWLLEKVLGLFPILSVPLINWHTAGWHIVTPVTFFIYWLLNFAMLGWLLAMADETFDGQVPDPVRCLRRACRSLHRVCAVVVTGYLAMFGALALAMKLLPVLIPKLGLFGLLLLLPFQFGINLMALTTASSMDAGLKDMNPFRRWWLGLRAGLVLWRRLFWPVALGTVVLGGVVVILWSGEVWNSETGTATFKHLNSFKINLLPLFDLHSESRWYTEWSEATGVSGVEMTDYFFSLLNALWSTLLIIRFTREWKERYWVED